MNTYYSREIIDDAEKDDFELMNNSIHGRTTENVRNRLVFRLITKLGEFF